MSKLNPAAYLREVRQETRKVTWPTRKETLVSTIMVFALVVVSAVFFVSVDAVIGLIVRMIFGLGD